MKLRRRTCVLLLILLAACAVAGTLLWRSRRKPDVKVAFKEFMTLSDGRRVAWFELKCADDVFVFSDGQFLHEIQSPSGPITKGDRGWRTGDAGLGVGPISSYVDLQKAWPRAGTVPEPTEVMVPLLLPDGTRIASPFRVGFTVQWLPENGLPDWLWKWLPDAVGRTLSSKLRQEVYWSEVVTP